MTIVRFCLWQGLRKGNHVFEGGGDGRSAGHDTKDGGKEQ